MVRARFHISIFSSYLLVIARFGLICYAKFMNNYEIFNKSSASMGEVKSDSIDLVITSPPYNLETHYGDNQDRMPLNEYLELQNDVILECQRVLKPEGKMIVEVLIVFVQMIKNSFS